MGVAGKAALVPRLDRLFSCNNGSMIRCPRFGQVADNKDYEPGFIGVPADPLESEGTGAAVPSVDGGGPVSAAGGKTLFAGAGAGAAGPLAGGGGPVSAAGGKTLFAGAGAAGPLAGAGGGGPATGAGASPTLAGVDAGEPAPGAGATGLFAGKVVPWLPAMGVP
jgi:hypothetical protein